MSEEERGCPHRFSYVGVGKGEKDMVIATSVHPWEFANGGEKKRRDVPQVFTNGS